jgi:hypothetical protein
MPWEPVEKEDDGTEVCAFCGAVDPDDVHQSQHRVEPCISRPVKERTYRNKKDFQEHLLSAHDWPAITERIEGWAFPQDSTWYWHCGFCDVLLSRWTDRVVHIGDHFKEGMAMSAWDPLTPPHPIDKATGAYAAWFSPSCWDAGILLALELEQCTQIDR